MTKTHKAVLSTLAVLCLLFMGSGVAQAQECLARTDSKMVRAAGITEVVGEIELKCRIGPEGGFSFGAADMLTIAVELDTNITNEIDGNRGVALASETPVEDAYLDGGITLMGFQLEASGADTTTPLANPNVDTIFMDGKLSDDGTMIEWKDIPKASLGLDNDTGFKLTISGIRANAVLAGAGEDIMATVTVNDTVIGVPGKVADVETALDIKVAAPLTGVQCESKDDEIVTTITIQESKDFENAIMAGANVGDAGDSLAVTFLHIPEGVKVTVPAAFVIPDMEAMGVTFEDADPAIGLTRRTGRTSGADMDGVVDLSASGAGQVIYDVTGGTTNDMLDKEWAYVNVTFEWESEGDMPALGKAYVLVSFVPMSTEMGDTFDDGAKLPRFAESDDTVMVLQIDDCATTLLFPFVTNKGGFDTGIAITNTSAESGSCSISYHGDDGGDAWMTPEVAEEGHTVFVTSAKTPGFQGYIMADCGFRKAYGFAFVTGPENTMAHGYLAVVDP